jgi:uncharacterized protein YjaG (DUF416 family)
VAARLGDDEDCKYHLKRDAGVLNNKPDTFDEYERHTAETLQAWSPEQRVAFAAAVAERWLQAYEKFSAAEGEGDAAVLRRIVDAVWDHVQGRLLTPTDANRLDAQISEHAPDTEDFDGIAALRALLACQMLGQALECCQKTDNTAIVLRVVRSAVEAVLGDFPSDLAGQRRAWQRSAVQEEVRKQSALREAVGAIVRFDDQTIASLRSGLGPAERSGRAGRARPPSKKKRVDEDGIEGHRAAVRAFLKKSAVHRIAFVAALAERLLPHYKSFAAATGKGRPELLGGVLDAVWQAAKGQPVSAVALQDLQATLQQGALDPEAPEAWDAWSAWRLVELALACCGSADNTELAVEAALVAWERVAGRGSRNDPQIWTDMTRGQVWRRDNPPKLYSEILEQMGVLMRLHNAMPALDDHIVATLRSRS